MKTYDELLQQWQHCRGEGQILVDSKHPLRMYLNVSLDGNKELLIPVKRREERFKSTAAIGIKNYASPQGNFFAIELLQPSVESEFLCLCFDLIESSRNYSSTDAALHALFDAFKKWYYLLADPKRNILPESEIRGLLGEIKYIIDEINKGIDENIVINAWTIVKDASRDFIFDNTWSEVKTIENSKDYVSISSIEQLDHDIEGTLVVYKLERTNQIDKDSVSLNDLIKKLKNQIGFQAETSLTQKLRAKGYIENELYDEYSYLIREKLVYKITGDFPRLLRKLISPAIISAKYDIRINLLEGWRINEQ